MAAQVKEKEKYLRALRDIYVYPGHPIVLACHIMLEFDSLKDALCRKEEGASCNALVCIDIPGAGGSVHAAIHFLKEIGGSRLELLESEDIMMLAEKWWVANSEEKKSAGTYFARSALPIFFVLVRNYDLSLT